MAVNSIKSVCKSHRSIISVVAATVIVLVPVLLILRQLTHFKKQHQSTNRTELPNYEPRSLFGGDLDGSYVIKSPFAAHFPRLVGEPIVINTRRGQLRGIETTFEGRSVTTFLGVTYAEPPIRELRFMLTVPIRPWSGIRDATRPSPHCMQDQVAEKIAGRDFITDELSEDCLHLNIWTPSTEGRRPIMIWIFGGGFSGGTINMDETQGQALAALGNVVVVSVNYRNGAFGFLDLGPTTNATGNQGLWDIVTAIEWVRDNGRDLGGDPDQITLFGNSAGAISIGLLMANPKTSQLFKRAIFQSGSPFLPNTFYDKGERVTRNFLRNANCRFDEPLNVLNCLQSLSPEQIVEAQEKVAGFPFGPKIDNQLINAYPIDYFSHDQRNRSDLKPVLMGANADEGSIVLHFNFPELFTNTDIKLNVTTLTEMRDLTENKFAKALNIKHEHAVLLAELFFTNGTEVDTTENLVRRLQRALGDLAFTCPVLALAKLLSKNGHDTYVYQFGQRAQGSKWARWMGATHGDEYPLIFGTPIRYPDRYSADDIQLSRDMIDLWSSFAYSGVPSKDWPRYRDDDERYLLLKRPEEKDRISTRMRENTCALFSRAVGL